MYLQVSHLHRYLSHRDEQLKPVIAKVFFLSIITSLWLLERERKKYMSEKYCKRSEINIFCDAGVIAIFRHFDIILV